MVNLVYGPNLSIPRNSREIRRTHVLKFVNKPPYIDNKPTATPSREGSLIPQSSKRLVWVWFWSVDCIPATLQDSLDCIAWPVGIHTSRPFSHVAWCSSPRGLRGRIRPQHPLACRKRRLNWAACLSWAVTRFAWGKDPGGWGPRLTAMSSVSNTPLWPLLVLDGRLNLARFNQSAGRAEPRTTDKVLWAQLGCIEVLYI